MEVAARMLAVILGAGGRVLAARWVASLGGMRMCVHAKNGRGCCSEVCGARVRRVSRGRDVAGGAEGG